MSEEEIKELSGIITTKLVSKILIKLQEIEGIKNKKISKWDYDDVNMILYGEFEDGREFSLDLKEEDK